jgi:hypothetical protein
MKSLAREDRSVYVIFASGNWRLNFILQIIPRVAYADIVNGLSPEQIKAIKQTGTIVVTGGVPKEVSLKLAIFSILTKP